MADRPATAELQGPHCGARVETMRGDAYECRLAPHSRDERHRDGGTTWMTAPNETRPERIGNVKDEPNA